MTDSTNELRARAGRLLPADRQRFLRRLGGVDNMDRGDRRSAALAAVAADLARAEDKATRRRSAVPKEISYPADLPITERRPDLLETIRANQVVIVAGETGSGKSTQLPKLCL
ncbi:MAG: hypothetical protein OEO77_12715, partial [Acidimicrobiia bacterium]|nr:hypothetical protein [Acidimicrobiia bacterium]